MTNCKGIALLLLLGLPVAAAADAANPAGADLALCADMAERFRDQPRTLSIADLDTLRGCINSQQDLLRSAQRSSALAERRVARASLHDDL